MTRKLVGISLTEEEHENLTKVAITKGISPSAAAAGYVRDALPVFKSTEDFEDYIMREGLVGTAKEARAVTTLAKSIFGQGPTK